MQSFEVSSGTPLEFVERVRRELEQRGLGEHVSLWLEGDDLVVQFRWMGTTVLRYRWHDSGGVLRAELVEERVSPFHGAFRHTFEERFDQVLHTVGARTT